ncbi:type II secretion system protein M [Sphingomonas sp. S1-29]|uniref:type II secretion system protein M n=1 Tax=Sphingomonas sp. S1-29 TaxID=2991074 RepID=UPI00224095AA|nr:type II secretion system protein M [Sphingomonas sp. S1-29]UZK70509.1 type II secretion system protein M [Sphingomonas sp. S1-29]
MRTIRIIERSRIESALLRLDTWWSGLTQRERLLVSILGTLLAAVVLVYGVIKPIQDARAEAQADIRTYETLNARIRAAGTLTPNATRREGPPEAIVTGAAQGFGLAPTVTPIEGGVRAAVTDASYDNVVGWIAEVSRSSALGVVRTDIVRRPTPGHVAATIEFAQ